MNTDDEKVVNVKSDEIQTEDVVDVNSFQRMIETLAVEQNDPVIGEIWKTRWRSIVQIVVVIAENSNGLYVSPLSYDVALGDDAAVHLSVSDQTLGFEAVAWTSLNRVIPLFAFDVRLGEVKESGLASVATPDGVGAPILSSLDERSQVRDAIEERMDNLADANWLPDVETHIDLATALRERNFRTSDLAKFLEIEPGFATALIRGDRKLTTSQSSLLSRILRMEDQTPAINSRVDPILVNELNRPRYRRELWRKGLESGATDEGEWKYEVATTLPVAARTTNQQSPRERWAGLIEEFLRAD